MFVVCGEPGIRLHMNVFQFACVLIMLTFVLFNHTLLTKSDVHIQYFTP